ncbi:MAG: class I SAM-dependent methyltransferase [Burkholderiales bacterium]|nr:class I SAM-dependent methyltransferase [Burkholderiales bacterium]
MLPLSRKKLSFFSKHKDAPPVSEETPTAFPAGHFYSPLVDAEELAEREAELWPATPPVILGIDFNEQNHRQILTEDFPRFIGDYDYPEKENEVTRESDFFTQNSQFSWLDARALFVLMRKWRPAQIIEVGSGFSSLLMADINRRFLNGNCSLTCIEPYPRAFLKQGVPGISKLIEKKVQQVPLETFDALESGDILFIDSSHVSKTGSDVNYLFFEVLPRLKAGVKIHIHDIFLPNEYLKDWVLKERRSWDEQYLLRALLMYSSAFKVIFGCSYAFATTPDKVKTALAHPHDHAFSGGSFWIERT